MKIFKSENKNVWRYGRLPICLKFGIDPFQDFFQNQGFTGNENDEAAKK